MNSKSLMIEIETLYREQRERYNRRPGAPQAPTTRYQLDFAFKNLDIFEDVNKALITFMTANLGLNSADDAGFKNFLKTFVNRFFFFEEKASKSTLPENEANGGPIAAKDVIMADVTTNSKIEGSSDQRKSFSFYANTNFYVFFRLYQVCIIFSNI
jgi:histone deacetylase complex regulatory component SIN3